MSRTILLVWLLAIGWAAPWCCAREPATDPTPAPPTFTRDVIPVLTKASCNSGACHGSFQGRGGLQLSLLGFDPLIDYDTLAKSGRGRRLNPASPAQSLLLLKATGSVPHGGGKRIEVGDDIYRTLYDYIGGGIAPPTPDDPVVVALEVEPADVTLKPEQHGQLAVRARWSDGQVRDVTRLAQYDSREKMVVEVSSEGQVTALRAGQSPVTVRFMGQVAAVPVIVPFESSHTAPLAAADATEPDHYVDRFVAEQWQRLGLTPAPLADDSEFVRRVYLDLIGTLPTPEDVVEFLESSEPNKRAELIDRLLERPEFVDYWSLKWGDLLRVHRRYVGEKGLASFWGWVRRAVRENRPVDQMARELLTAQGNLYSSGPVAFYIVDAKPEELAETVAQVFLGVRMQCMRCHHHPLEVWGQEDYYGLAACFTRVELKDNGDNGRFGGAKLVRPVDAPPKNRQLLFAADPALFGTSIEVEPGSDLRGALAEAITSAENPFFARNFANRIWAWVMGRGLVEPVDDFRATNPPSHPELLDALAADFVKHNYDVKQLLRTICNSRTYQLASDLAPQHDREGMFYTHRVVRRLSAEVLLDAVNQVTGYTEQFTGVPAGTRAIALPDPSVQSFFLDTFGRPTRASPCECARTSDPNLIQALHLVNGSTVHEKITIAGGRLARHLDAKHPIDTVIDEFYLAALARRPTNAERATIARLLDEAPSQEEGLEDLVWTLLNCSEFVFNH